MAVLSAVLVVGNINAVFADGDISVRMNEIVSNDVSYINLRIRNLYKSITEHCARKGNGGGCGMEVEWDQRLRPHF